MKFNAKFSLEKTEHHNSCKIQLKVKEETVNLLSSDAVLARNHMALQFFIESRNFFYTTTLINMRDETEGPAI